MTILRDCELWHPRLNPKRPNAMFNKENPTWELQIRTYDKKQKAEWEAAGLKVTPVVPEEDDAKPFWRVNLRKKSIKSTGEPSGPVEVIDGHCNPVDPDTIGNMSVGHVRLFKYEFEDKVKKTRGSAFVLMGLQLKKHVVYAAKERTSDFADEGSTEVVVPPSAKNADNPETGSDSAY